jgi:hypothetical protein
MSIGRFYYHAQISIFICCIFVCVKSIACPL